ncbi:MAG: FG-GAP repeat protein [Methanosarcinales archaeon]|nr:FG-GAP repeat protein [Methanosarcinales archaeon]
MVTDFFLVLIFSVVANGRFLAYSEKRGSLSASLRLCVSALNRRNAKAQRRKGAKELICDERAQLQTLEGFAAALLMVGTVYLAVTAVTLSVPQTELHIDAQLKTYGRDALAILDAQIPPEDEKSHYTSSLKNSVVGWMNGAEGATNWETEEFRIYNGTHYVPYTVYKFRYCSGNHTFYAYIPNNTRVSHAYVTLTGMPRLDDSCITDSMPLELEPSNTSFPDHFGCAIAHGDVNDDNVSDMVVGACGNSSGHGAVYVYYGNESGISAWTDDGPNVTIVNPGASGDRFGWAVACGDVNGDNVSDVVVGAYMNDSNQTDAGAAYIYYGGTSMSAPNVTMTDPAVDMGNDDDWFGYSLACGDVNGDGFDDVLAGAPGVWKTESNAGKVFVYYGNGSLSTILTTEDGALYNPYHASDFFGVSVACLDISGAGTQDIAVGANNNSSTYIYFGESLPTSSPFLLNSIDDVDLPLIGGTGFGTSVARAGDVNKDGADDLIVGAPGNDTAHIFYGGDSGNPPDNTSDINLTGTSNSGFGRSVSSSGDVDSDGYAGVVVGIPNSTNASVFYDVDLGIGQIELSGASGSGFGSVVSEIGDVDDDGIPDIAVGAPDADSDAGKVYVYTPRFPETPWLAVGNGTDLANGNGTKVWEYTTVIKTDNGNHTTSWTTPIHAGNSTNKTLAIYREITTDATLSVYAKTSLLTNVSVSVNGVEVNATSLPTDSGGNWTNITLPGDITEWRIGDNNITINVTSGTLELGLDSSAGKAKMIRVTLPIIQPFKTTETTSDFTDAINNWMDAHPLHGNLSDTGNISSYQWIDESTNETGWAVPFRLHSDSSGAINVTNLHVRATASLEENLYTLLPDFIEYNVVFAYLNTLTKGHVYTFSDGMYSNTSTFDESEGGNKTLSIILPRNTTEVYIAKMTVCGGAVEDSECVIAERVNTSTKHQHDPCIAVNATGTAVLTWTQGSGGNQRIYSAIHDGTAWSAASPVNDSSDERQQASTLGVNNSCTFVGCEQGNGAHARIFHIENGIGGEVNTSSDTQTQTEPSLGVNDSGWVFIAWVEDNKIYYSEYNRTAWSPAVPVNSSGHTQNSPSLAVNDSGWVFIAWVEDNKIYYSEYNRTAWSPAMQISSAAQQSSPTIAVNDSGWVFAAGVHGTGANAHIYYSLYNRTAWGAPERVGDDEVAQTDPEIAVDSNNHTHIVWEQLGGVYHSSNTGSGWGAPVVITEDGTNPTIDLDPSGKPHIAWENDRGIWYVNESVSTNYYGSYPTLPYIAINNSIVWEYNITKINHDDTSAKYQILCNNSSITKVFDIGGDADGPVTLSIYAGGNNSSFDLYVNDVYARSGYTNDTTMWWNITTSQDLWQRNDNIVRINVTSGCAKWYYDNSTDNTTDYYVNQSNRTSLDTDNTWMIRLYGHEYRGTQTTDDFSDALNRCLDPNATTDYTIPITVHSDSKGNITLSRLRIYYYIRGDKTEVAQTRVITHNVPPSDTVTVTRLVTIHETDVVDATEAEKRVPDAGMAPNIPIVNMVEVRLEMWYR